MLGNTVRAYLGANMAENTPAHATARDWRMVMLAGATTFVAGYALFHFVLPVGARVRLLPEPMDSVFAAGLVAPITHNVGEERDEFG